MARGPIEIPVAVDTGGVEKSIQNGLIDPIEDADKALEQLGKTDAGRDIDKAMDKAQDATEELSDELDDARKSVEKLKYAAKDAGDDGASGLGKIKGATQEVTQEMGQNLGEAVSSIRGDISDLGQVGQDTLGGLAATLAGTGPTGLVGAAVLAAGAVGLGLVTAELQKQQEEAEKLRDRIGSVYQDAADNGRAYLETAQLIAEANDVMFNPDRADEYKRLQEDAKTLGLEMTTVIAANAGDLESLEEVQGRINALSEEELAKRSELGLVTGSELSKYGEGLLNVRDRWQQVNDVTEENAEKARNANAVTSEFLANMIRDAGTATEEVDAFGNKLLTLPSGEQVVIDAETGQAHQDLDRFKGDVDGIANTVATKTMRLALDTSAWDNWRPNPKTGVIMAQVSRSVNQER